MSAEQPAPTPPAGERPRYRRIWLFAAVAVTVLALDIVSKLIVVATIKPDDPPRRLLGGVIYLQQARNSGAAFSLGTSFTAILTVVAVVVVVVLIRIASRLRSTAWALAFGFILGGAIGNLVDRFFRSPGPGRGHVVDWISIFGPNGDTWPIFNVADSGIVIGAVLAAGLAFIGIDFDGKRDRKKDADTASGGTA